MVHDRSELCPVAISLGFDVKELIVGGAVPPVEPEVVLDDVEVKVVAEPVEPVPDVLVVPDDDEVLDVEVDATLEPDVESVDVEDVVEEVAVVEWVEDVLD